MPCEVHYELAGPPGAPVLALSCSLGTDLSMWDAQVERLSRRLRVLRYDLRGHALPRCPTGRIRSRTSAATCSRCSTGSRSSAPTFVISGRDDPATPPEHGRLIASGIASARFEVVPDAAHLANIQQPDVVGELIERHLLAAP
jgi:pimeloyl-ACP methyl ester carboxylesterase